MAEVKREFYQEMILEGHSMLHQGYRLIEAAIEDADDAAGRKLIDEAKMRGLASIVPVLKHFKLME